MWSGSRNIALQVQVRGGWRVGWVRGSMEHWWRGCGGQGDLVLGWGWGD